MFTLKELGVSIASAPVTLRGKSRMVRKLSIAEQDAITRARASPRRAGRPGPPPRPRRAVRARL